jgi:hypothetical protein
MGSIHGFRCSPVAIAKLVFFVIFSPAMASSWHKRKRRNNDPDSPVLSDSQMVARLKYPGLLDMSHLTDLLFVSLVDVFVYRQHPLGNVFIQALFSFG